MAKYVCASFIFYVFNDKDFELNIILIQLYFGFKL